MTLIISTLTYVFVSALITARFFKERFIGTLLIVFFNFAVMCNILISEILSLFDSLNNPLIFLLVQIVVCAIICFLIIFPNRIEVTRNLKDSLKGIKLSKPAGLIPMVFILLIIGVVFGLGLLGVTNNTDSLHTHLPRIYYWLQHGSFENWDTGSHTQLNYPINTSIQGLYLFLLGGSEKIFFLVHLFALIVILMLVFEISFIMGARGMLLFTPVLLTLSFPVVLLQVYSFQGDLFVAALVLSCVFLVTSFVKEKRNELLILSAIPLAVSLGAKQTAFIVLPVFLLLLWSFLFRKVLSTKVFLKVSVLFLTFFLLISAQKFIQNYLDEKTMFEDINIKSTEMQSEMPIKGYVTNGFRYAYQAFSIDGLVGDLQLKSLELKNNAFRRFSSLFGITLDAEKYIRSDEETYFNYNQPETLNENSAWFGPLSIPLILATTIIIMIRKQKLQKRYLFISLFLLFAFFGSLVLFKGGWGPNRGRYLITPIVIFMPLTYCIVPQRKVWAFLLSLALSFACLLLITSTLVFNDSRLLINNYSLVHFREHYINNIEVTNIINSQYRKRLFEFTNSLIKTTPEKKSYLNCNYYGRLFYQFSMEGVSIDFLNKYFEEREPLYLSIEKTNLEYALFGINKTRDLFPISNFDDVKSQSYLLVSKNKHFDDLNFMLIAENDEYQIFYKP